MVFLFTGGLERRSPCHETIPSHYHPYCRINENKLYVITQIESDDFVFKKKKKTLTSRRINRYFFPFLKGRIRNFTDPEKNKWE